MNLTLTKKNKHPAGRKTVKISVQKTADNDCMRIILETHFDA